MRSVSSRRRFIQYLAGTAISAAASGAGSRIRIGAQTNTWGAPIKSYDHLLEILDALVKLGYEGFETNYVSLAAKAGNAKQCHFAFECRRIECVAPHTNVNFLKTADAHARAAEHLIASGQRDAGQRLYAWRPHGRSTWDRWFP